MLSYWHKLRSEPVTSTPGVTSELSGLVTYLVGALVYHNHFWIATTLTIASNLLLALKDALEGLAKRIAPHEILTFTKFLLLTDRPVDLKDFRATLTHLLERTRPETDLYVFSNTSMDTLDYTGPRVNEGSKGVWLGLGEPVRELPREFSAADLPQGVTEIRVFSPGCLVFLLGLFSFGLARRDLPFR
jgi:hypothetical protein